MSSIELIRADVAEQVERFVGDLREAFDPEAYPQVRDGERFDSRLAEVHRSFERLEKLFHDFLMAAWSDEVAASVKNQDK